MQTVSINMVTELIK